jgi:hypothetical protein
MSISERYLEGAYLKRYEKIAKDVERLYSSLIRDIKSKVPLTYFPTVYITPFVIKKKTPIFGTGQSVYRTFYNLTYVDVENFDRMAVYSTIEFLEKFPKFIQGGLGHELAHFVAEKGMAGTSADDILRELDPLQAIHTKEARKDEALGLFPEELKNLIRTWDKLSAEKSTAQTLLENAWPVDFDVFEEIVFDDKREELDKFIERKMKIAFTEKS